MEIDHGLDLGVLEAKVSMTANQHKIVKVSTTANKFELCGDGEKALGVLQDKPAIDVAGKIRTFGATKVLSGAAFSVGANLAPDANGKAITAVSGKYTRMVALEAATDADQLVSAYIFQDEKVA